MASDGFEVVYRFFHVNRLKICSHLPPSFPGPDKSLHKSQLKYDFIKRYLSAKGLASSPSAMPS